MEKKNKTLLSEYPSSDIRQHEDAVLKTSMQFFADEILPYLGIQGKVISFAPTKGKNIEEIAEDLEETPELIKELIKTL